MKRVGFFSLFGLFVITSRSVMSSTSAMQQPNQHTTTIERPALVEEALKANKPLYYFGLGSNMLKSKLENRSSKGKIELLSFEPAKVINHRLAFNMRGFVPIEPAMGALEPVEYPPGEKPCTPLHAYERPECHGALVQLTAENYELVMASEGISKENPNPGYEEVVVTAIPYDTTKGPVEAIALRALPHVRLQKDPAPSARYMKILREGASELGLDQCYQDFLASHPVQQTPNWLKRIAMHNLIFTFTLNSSFGNSTSSKRPMISRLQTWLLFQLYVPPNGPPLLRGLGDLATTAVLLPGSLIGVGIRAYRHVTKTEHPPFMKRILGLMSEEDKQKQQQATTKEAMDRPVVVVAAAKEPTAARAPEKVVA